MMNKKQTSRMGAIKYAVLLPVAVSLLLFNSLDAISSKNGLPLIKPVIDIQNEAPAAGQQVTEAVSPQDTPPKKAVVNDAPPPPPKKAVVVVKKDSKAEKVNIEDASGNVTTENVFNYVEEMPRYPGGDAAMVKFVQENLRYPIVAQEANIQGTVVVRLIISSEGKVGNVTVVKSVDPVLDEEAIKLVKTMPNWTPGKKDGKPVGVYFQLPMRFKLNELKENPK
jgi:TonB family protein